MLLRNELVQQKYTFIPSINNYLIIYEYYSLT